jgi:hypothetical protein
VKRFFRSRWFKIPAYTLTIGFALIGFFLTASYVAILCGFTQESGSVDVNNRYFQAVKYDQAFETDSATVVKHRYEALHRILLLNDYYPKNAQYVMNAFEQSGNETEVLRMLDAIDMQLRNNKGYMKKVKAYKQSRRNRHKSSPLSVYDWMNISEWSDFKVAVAKDKVLIDSVARLTGVESRLIVCCLVGEQIRLFNSNREAYKKWIGPLKVLSVESQFSLGVTGIKELTAQRIESHLKNPKSQYYLGEQYEHLLDFHTTDTLKERVDRLTSYRNHYYSYLYAAIFLKQVKTQWEKAGYPIDRRPEILATLFNVGFPQSVPKADPRVGGSTIRIYEKPYSFGAIAYQFYYSGELFDLFPFEKTKFDWNADAI